MKFTIITVTYNRASTLRDTIQSVLLQTYPDIEYIIIDGASTDNTLNIVKEYELLFKGRLRWLSERDKGLYDALNKGINMASGDIIGALHSDDFFCDNYVIENIMKSFQEEDIDALYGDIKFVDPSKTDRTVRYYSSKKFKPDKFRYGYMPAHPSFYAKKNLFKSLGNYKDDYKIAADFELMMRFILISKIKTKYIKQPLVTMRTGGVSTKSLKSNYIINKEIMRACRENGIRTNYFNIYSKYLAKIFELR